MKFLTNKEATNRALVQIKNKTTLNINLYLFPLYAPIPPRIHTSYIENMGIVVSELYNTTDFCEGMSNRNF